jgi:hypothetical protein
MTHRILLSSVLTLAAALVLASGALAATLSASSGDVTVHYSYTVTKGTYLPAYSHEMVTIVRDGSTVYDRPVSGCPDCGPAGLGTRIPSLQLVDLDHTGEPNVVLSLYSGGAHCCTIAQVFSYDAADDTYTVTAHNFADPAFTLKRLTPGGDERFVSRNPAFEYEYTSYAQSGEPLQIWGFADGAFTDVTRSYPALIAKDARLWLRLFKHNLRDGTGPLSAWAADEEELGHHALVQTTLKAQLKTGHLIGGFVNGARYVTLLNRQLIKLGYEK